MMLAAMFENSFFSRSSVVSSIRPVSSHRTVGKAYKEMFIQIFVFYFVYGESRINSLAPGSFLSSLPVSGSVSTVNRRTVSS